MQSWRFLVTNVLILATAAFLARNTKTEKHPSQVDEGNHQIQAAATIQLELKAKYAISLQPVARFDWNRLSKMERQSAKEKLAEFVSALSRTFEIDAKKGFYLTQEELLKQQLGTAMGLQKSLEDFERTYGENFEPKKPKDQA